MGGAFVKVLVTGAKGFIGRNLVERLKSDVCPGVSEVLEFDRDDSPELLEEYCADCDFVFHLAGVNRPDDPAEFTEGNVDLTVRLLSLLKARNACPVLLSSSTQAELDNPYGVSKRAAEDAVLAYTHETGAAVYVYRLPGVFGKWSRPGYNSVVATFCHNIARGLPIEVRDPEAPLSLVYIDDVVREFISALDGTAHETAEGRFEVPVVHDTTLGDIVRLLEEFRDSRTTLSVPRGDDAFERKLYSTYLSYLPTDAFSYPLTMRSDERGSFTEMIRTPDRGQFSVNVIKPGVTKGDHWHDSKNEKFVVVAGAGVIRFRAVGAEAVVEYAVSVEHIEVVDIPPGYTHNIENTGDDDMVVFMWCNECYDPENPDTHAMVV
jgi:UDP-2-acetamido-2,6-beta-L-arabino-hexul-4-ose reductase